jgi:putative spermidine/putrescine transport system substrate-binding protein
VEDFQEQEYEFLRRLEEEKVGRKTLLKRGLVAGAGLTVMSLSPAALASRKKALADPPTIGRLAKLSDIVAAAKKEGKLNTIALPPDWANYGEIMSTFQAKYGIKITNDNPNGSSSEENAAIVALKGDPRAPDVVDVNPTFAVDGATKSLYAKYYTTNFRKVPRAMKDGRGFWVGDYWGAVSIGASKSTVSNVPKTFADLLKPEYKGKVALNGSPLTSGSGRAGVVAAAIANGGSLGNTAPGIDWFAKLKSVGNWVPVPATPQTVASGQTPIVIDWDYLNLAYGKEFPSAQWVTNIPVDGVYGAHYAQAVNLDAPHPWAARLWQEFLYSDQGQLLFLKGYSHPALFTDMVARKVVPNALIKALPDASLYAKVKFQSVKQGNDTKIVIKEQWPAKMGS